MRLQVLNLDDSILGQEQLLEAHRPDVIDLRSWGPRLRLGCSFSRFRAFERHLATQLPRAPEPALTFVGSGDFHHVSLALIRRVREPFVLVILDNHPDWMAGIPFLHCGTWVHHALRHGPMERVVHLGGNVDFDNAFHWLAPRRALRKERILVAPAHRTFGGRLWQQVPQTPLQVDGRLDDACLERLVERLTPHLRGRAVYLSLDKDVFRTDEAVVNWDSGSLRLAESFEILARLFDESESRLIGMDVVGDWSPVRTEGVLRRVLHWTEHPSLAVVPEDATRINEEANLSVVDFVESLARTAPRAGRGRGSKVKG